MAAANPPNTTRILCLGDGHIDLICEHPADGPDEVDAFAPHFGGTEATIAVGIARAGAKVALAGAVGDDRWGRWYRTALVREGVDATLFRRIPGRQTPLALVTLDQDCDPHDTLYAPGESPGQGSGLFAPTGAPARDDTAALEKAVGESAALFFGSGSLLGDDRRQLTFRARELALEQGRHVIFAPNVRLADWGTRSDAQATALECVPGALLVRLNLFEAQLLTGENDPERAAISLLKTGARMVAITFGAEGAMLRGEFRADVPAADAEVRSTIGAGAAFTATLLARLALTGYYAPAIPAAMKLAAAEAARACERWGAVD